MKAVEERVRLVSRRAKIMIVKKAVLEKRKSERVEAERGMRKGSEQKDKEKGKEEQEGKNRRSRS